MSSVGLGWLRMATETWNDGVMERWSDGSLADSVGGLIEPASLKLVRARSWIDERGINLGR